MRRGYSKDTEYLRHVEFVRMPVSCHAASKAQSFIREVGQSDGARARVSLCLLHIKGKPWNRLQKGTEETRPNNT